MNSAGSTDDVFEHAIHDDPTRVVVIGGGAAGLVAARDIARPGFDVTVLEARDELGGSVARHEVAGIPLDAGAESFATRGGHVAELLDELGLGGDVVKPLAAGAWLRLPGRAVPMPKAGVLGIPSSPMAADVIAAIGARAAFRAYLDRLIPVLKIGEEHDLGKLVRRRMGESVLRNLVAPVTTGVYSASPDDLDVSIAAPGLNQAITRAGSLSGGVDLLRASAKAGSAVGGLVGGMARLVDVLAADAVARGAVLRTGAEVVALRPAGDESSVEREDSGDAETGGTDESATAAALAASVDEVFDASSGGTGEGSAHGSTGGQSGAADTAAAERADVATGGSSTEPSRPGRWLVRLADGETLVADAVVVAAPAEQALRLLGQASETLSSLARLGWPSASAVDIVTLVVDDARLDAAPRGTGMLVAETVPQREVAAKAMTHVTAKWPWVAELLPAGRHVLRLSYGRVGSPSPLEGLDDRGIRLQALADASTLLNIPLAESSVVGSDAVRWTNAVPAAAQGQRARIDRVLAELKRVEALEATGSWLTGTGLASVVPDARKAAERIRAVRWNSLTDKD
jgi:oxygen-dependent protoporphyrinogen oxidase